MTTSALSPFSRQYSCACSTCRTSATSSSPTTRTSRIGRSPEMPCGHRPGLAELVRRQSCRGAARSEPSANEHARRQALEQQRLVVRDAEMAQAALRVRERERERARRPRSGRGTSARAPRPSRDPTRCRWRSRGAPTRPATSRIRWRRLTIGSSTTPVVPDSARPSSAAGSSVSRPRPRNRARSVSHSTGPCGRPSRLRTCTAHSAGVARIARRAGGRAAPRCRPGTRSRETACRTPDARDRRPAAPGRSPRSW